MSIYRHRVKISAQFGETEKLAVVDPENLISDHENGEHSAGLDSSV